MNEAIILAGGFGTRLSSLVKDVPKPMANVNGKPFLAYLLGYINKYNIKRVILSVGYKWEIIRKYFGFRYLGMDIVYAIEDKPLGTGGAIKNSLRYAYDTDVLVMNGDTFFKINLDHFFKLHKNNNSLFSIALKKVNNTSRYGTIVLNNNIIVSFKEKAEDGNSLINGGVYIINKEFYLSLADKEVFSLEKDFLETYYKSYNFYGFVFDDYFIDIGVPEDYLRAQDEFKELKY